jgi:3-oxoacyl-[acyl-carrier protein] reductase/pteridine reductase
MTAYDLGGKSALVTGGARRIGRAIALAFAGCGADVAITYRSSKAEADQTSAAIAALGVRSMAIECDVRSEAAIRGAVQSAAGRFGKLDLLVNNAAIFLNTPFGQVTVDEWNAVFETNTRGPFLFAREALPYLRAAHGRIVNLGSLGGLRAWPDHAHYCSSKAALHMLTQTMARAFAPEISVNCVAPGSIDAGGNDTSERAMRFAEKTPMKRNGAAEDIAEAVLFFAAGPNFVTGQILAVDGGLGLV